MTLTKLAIYVVLGAVLLYFARKYYFSGGWCHSNARIDGKVVVVTGANTGIGRETVLDLVKRGGRVYMACRAIDKCQTAAGYVKKEAKATDANVLTMQLDLSSLRSVRRFAAEFAKKESKLDILINNAGVMWIPDRTVTEDGFETTMGVNHLGHFLLTNLLMDQLFTAKPSRVVTVSSMGHTFYDIDFDDFMFEKEGAYGRQKSYSASKLANVLFSKELGNRLKGFGVTTYSLHPGGIRTELGRHAPGASIPFFQEILYFLMKPFIKTADEGAQTSICCAIDENLADESGKYYSDCVEKEPSEAAQSDESARRLWEVSAELVKLTSEETHPLLR